MTSKSKSILPNNGMALCIIIIVVVGLFIHYELGYNFELFNVGGQRGKGQGGQGGQGGPRRGGKGRRHKWYHHFMPRHFNRQSYYVETHTHPQNITFDKDKTDALFQRLDLDKSGSIEGTEFNSSLKGEVGNMMNDKNKYVFTA
jgi:hypothetical protein